MGNSNRDRKDWICHVLGWLGGILFLLTPFVYTWEIGPELPVRLGNSQFGFNLIIFGTLFFIGGILGGYWWRFCRWLRGECSSVLYWISIAWLLFTLVSILGFVSDSICYLGSFLILLLGLAYSYIYRTNKSSELYEKVKRRGFVGWFCECKPSNYLFFTVLFVVLCANNILVLMKLELGSPEMMSAIVGRVFFSGFITGVCYILCELSMRATPTRLRWSIWSLLALFPIIIAGDALLNQLFGRSQLELLNSLTATGEIDLMKELQGGGFQNLTPKGLIAILLLIYGVALGVTYLLWLISRKSNKMMSLCVICLLTVSCYLICLGEQLVGKQWKSLSSWQKEHKSFMLHQGIVSPQLGLANFEVEFRAYQPCAQPLDPEVIESVKSEGLPDIYFIMVESMRHDSLSNKTTPFLMEFEKQCQQLDSTWSGSNATHLSWYSLMYSNAAVHWMDDLERIPDKSNYGGSPVLQMLKSLGYNFEIRAVCDLGYKDFGLLNFGTEGQLCSVLKDSSEGSELSNRSIPVREEMMFESLKESVTQKGSEGGNFYFLALDSPHYNYYWGEDFKVPYDEYKEDISFPLFPNKEEVELYRNRYLNSVAWVDHQLEDFCEFLKSEGRYDNSIIILTADHGEEFQEEGGWCHCTSIMPEQTEVPILIKWPYSKKQVDKKLASHADIMPSLFSYLGISDEYISTMSGTNLLKPNGEHSILVATAYANKTGETMMLKRNGYTAYFSWSRPWEPRVPERMRLERIMGPDGDLIDGKEIHYGDKLRELFPDAFDKFFISLE